MIVTGVARDELLSRMFLGDTVDRLIRKSPVPVLIVRDRAFEPYHTMLVATDFSESSRVALATAIRFFPDTGLSLFHAYDVPFAGYLDRKRGVTGKSVSISVNPGGSRIIKKKKNQ